MKEEESVWRGFFFFSETPVVFFLFSNPTWLKIADALVLAKSFTLSPRFKKNKTQAAVLLYKTTPVVRKTVPPGFPKRRVRIQSGSLNSFHRVANLQNSMYSTHYEVILLIKEVKKCFLFVLTSR